MNPIILKATQQIEQDLTEFYGFKQQALAEDFLVCIQKNQESKIKDIMAFQGISEDRGATIFTTDGEHTDICIALGEPISESLGLNDPLNRLSNDNIDSFSVLVEEISHFHFIVNNLSKERQISLLELEWQGEIDKLVCTWIWLKRQSGHSHFYHVGELFFHRNAQINQDIGDRYLEANHLAHKFWTKISEISPGTDPFHTKEAQSFIKDFYKRAWAEKLNSISV